MSAVTSNIQFSYLKNGSWTSFNGTVLTGMDGIKIQTGANSPYYLQYRTWNEGKTGYYSYVKSNVNDYAGSSGKPIQQLQIQVYQNDGTKLVTGVVVMYRAKVEGTWLPWVSNAEESAMESVYDKYHLSGGMSSTASFAGKTGKNVEGIQILVYEEGENSGSGENFEGTEANPSLSYMVDNTSSWTTFNRQTVTRMDGLRIQTPGKPYYLYYRTWNEGKTDYYPYVKSSDASASAYAGSAGKPIQRVNIQVYDNSGTKLDSGVIVMFRAMVDGAWMPWVSNATGAWMRDMQRKYNLGGSLDTSNGFTGITGKNIQGLEIRVFEEDSVAPTPDDFEGQEINMSTKYMIENTSDWTNFTGTVIANRLDGIRIQTDPSLPFYLSYRTQNEGKTDYYSDVSSVDTSEAAYAGSAGKPIQRFGVYVFDKSGNKLTTGVVVMYRARINGQWQPWVSNADPDWMRNVHTQYNLMGTLDTESGHTGVQGQNIDGLEIRLFSGSSSSEPIGPLPGTESLPDLSYMVDNTANWTTFTQKATADHMDGIRIQTPGKPYYLYYRTKNAGKSDYYPFVRSDDTATSAYAGSAGKPIQRLGIQVYRKSDGAKLDTGIVVMYRVYANDHWLKWVSNATREWMESTKAKYNLDGDLDYSSGYAGLDGYNIKGVEIRIFEENNTDTPPQTPTGKSKIINDVPHITQKNGYPSGCESVSAVMALQYAKNNITVDDFIDYYLEKAPRNNFHPNVAFGGDPRQDDYGCYAPVIKKALDAILKHTLYEAKELHNVPLTTLCSEYIDNDIPVILWATSGMRQWRYTGPLYYNGTAYNWIAPEHCLVLIGYDDYNYIFNDPQSYSGQTYFSKQAVEEAYAGLLKQAIVIVGKNLDGLTPDEKYLSYKEQLRLTELQTLIAKYYTTPDGLNTVTDIEKVSALYDFAQGMRKQHYYSYYSDPEGKEILESVLPNRPDYKTTKVKLNKEVFFTPDIVKRVNFGQEAFITVLSLLPNTLAKFWAVLMSISLAAEKGESIDFLGFSLDQTPKIITYFKRFFGNTLTTILSALFGFFDKVYTIKGLDEAARDGEYCIYNDNKIYAGDAYFQFEVEYDLGTEHVVYDIYLRNGVPIILESYGPIRLDWPSDGYLPVGHVKGWIKEWKEDGYVLSQYHLDRNSTFNEDYGITE